MKKRGQLLYKFGMEILVAAIIILVFFGVSKAYGTGEAIAKIRTAKDIGLTIETLYSLSPEINTVIVYPEDTSKFDITIKNNLIEVFSTPNDVTKSTYHLIASQNYMPLNVVLRKPQKVYISRIHGNIEVSDEQPNLMKLKCGDSELKLEIKNVLIDSGLDEAGNVEKAKLSNAIAYTLISQLKQSFQVEHARNDDINTLTNNPLKPIKNNIQQKIEKSDLVISIKIGEKQDNSNNIKIYFSPNSAKKEEINELSCIILNNIIENKGLNEITGIAPIPKEDEWIIDNDKISIVIEIGNYLNQNSLDMMKDINKINLITSSIYEALKNEKTT